MTADLRRGTCRALYAFDLGRGIDLEHAEGLLGSSRRASFRHKGRALEDGTMPVPQRVAWSTEPVIVAGHTSLAEVEVAVYAIGAICISWALPVEATLEDLVPLSAELYDNTELHARSRRVAEEVAALLALPGETATIAAHAEDYTIFELGGTLPSDALEGPVGDSIARLLRAEEGRLSRQEIELSLARMTSYGDDRCIVDWLAALLVGDDVSEQRLVLELATVELLELRMLDMRLEQQITLASGLGSRPRRWLEALALRNRELDEVARLQAANVLVHEGIDNALKLFADDYLARLYRVAAERFHFDEWDVSIQRKLGVLQSVYETLASQAAHHRSEILEWIIIVLIAVDIVIYFVPG